MAKATSSTANNTAPETPAASPAVVRRYRASGECRELGIACIAHGYIVVEQLSDGTYRLGDESEPLLEPAIAPASAPVSEPASEPVSTPPGALSGQSDGAIAQPVAE